MVKHQKRSAKSAKSGSVKQKKSHKGKRAGASKPRQPKKSTKSPRKGGRKTGKKGTKSNYNLHIQHTVAQLKAADPNMTHQEAFKMAASQWRTSAENPKNQQN